jgi:hypothetical protein
VGRWCTTEAVAAGGRTLFTVAFTVGMSNAPSSPSSSMVLHAPREQQLVHGGEQDMRGAGQQRSALRKARSCFWRRGWQFRWPRWEHGGVGAAATRLARRRLGSTFLL